MQARNHFELALLCGAAQLVQCSIERCVSVLQPTLGVSSLTWAALRSGPFWGSNDNLAPLRRLACGDGGFLLLSAEGDSHVCTSFKPCRGHGAAGPGGADRDRDPADPALARRVSSRGRSPADGDREGVGLCRSGCTSCLGWISP